MAKDYSGIDGEILEAIERYEGVPTANNLSKENGGPLEYNHSLILERLKRNPGLQDALEIKGVKFVEICERKKFDECITTWQWINATGKIREAIDTRLDKFIAEAIESFKEVPTVSNLSKPSGGLLEYSRRVIAERLKKNPGLNEALEFKGIQFVENCDRKKFDECITTVQWTSITGKIKEAIEKRLDKHIAEAIESYEEVPTAKSLSKANSGQLAYGPKVIAERLKNNPDLQDALEIKGVKFVEICERKKFVECITTKKWNNVPEKVRVAIGKRLDKHIAEAIESYEEVPTAKSLSKANGGPLEYTANLIIEQLKKNPDLQQALETKGVQFVETCDMKKFDEYITTGQWNNVPEKVRVAIGKRLDKHIAEAIELYDGVPTANCLSKSGGGSLDHGRKLIGERITKNADLRRIFYLKRGLTEDRINALEIEQDDPSPSLKESITRRLPNTRIFREALGILKQFRELFEGKKTHEIAFYPEPLGRAAQMLGIQSQITYARAHKLKRNDFRFEREGSFDSVAFLQCCHRLESESLANTFNEANRILAEAGVLLVSLPHEYARTLKFETQIQDFGFELKAEGTLYTRTLGLEELASLGISEPEKLKQKLEQATNIIQLVKTRPAIGKAIDEFVPAAKLNGNGEFVPAMEEINTPEQLLLELSAVFQKKVQGRDEAFILSVLHDSDYDERHIVGFDMDPKKPKTVESVSKANAGVLGNNELLTLSNKILDSSFQEKVLVRPGRETRIPARLVRQALGS